MPEAKMTSKGQITVPAEVRRRLGLRAGSRVDFVATRDGSYELRVKRASVHDLYGCVDYSGPARTLAEMDDAIAEGAAQSMRS